MQGKFEIRLSGSGGQGLILSSIILAEAATLDGYFVTQTQSYGPEARGGASRAEVIISNAIIDYPLVRTPDVFLALMEEAYEKYSYDLREEGMVILDNSIYGKVYRSHVYSYPILETARNQLQSPISANMICLGVLTKFNIPVKSDSISECIQRRVPLHTRDINIKAFRLGKDMVK